MKIKSIILMCFVVITLVACGQTEEAKAVDVAIENFGEITLESEKDLSALEEQVVSLTEEEKATLKKIDLLAEYRQQYENLVKQEKISELEDVINEIGVVSLISESKIHAARNEYEQADDDIKSEISNYSKLVDAEEALSKCKIERAEQSIIEIGEINVASGSIIKKARSNYEELSNDEQPNVANYDVLVEAEKRYKELQELALDNLYINEDKFNGCSYYHCNSTPKYMNHRTYILPYIVDDGEKIFAVNTYDYYGRDWIFFDTIIILTDDGRYQKDFDELDIEHVVQGGVCEYIMEDVTAEDEKMYIDIAMSDTVEISFRGRTTYEYTMTEADKEGIGYLMLAYDYLRDNKK